MLRIPYNLEPITIDSLPEIKSFTSNFKPYSDYNFTSIYCWNTDDQAEFTFYNDNLILKMPEYNTDQVTFSLLGTTKIDETIHELSRHTQSTTGISDTLKYIPDIVIDKINQYASYRVYEDIDNNDYILSTDEAIKLEGAKYSNKRKKINKLLSSIGKDIKICELDLKNAKHIDEIQYINQQWKQESNSNMFIDVSDIKAIHKLLDNYSNLSKSLQIRCIGIRVNSVLEAYCIYELLEQNWAITHFGKALKTHKGMYEFMMVELLRYLNKEGVKYVNYEQDLGIPGLRENKQNAKPIMYLKKYCISLI